MTDQPGSEATGARLHGEEAIIQDYLAPLAAGFPGALGLVDDCAVLAPTPGHDLVLKTDPVAAGIHFLPDDDPADIGWKALAVNVSDLAAKAAVPRAYLMALSFPDPPTGAFMSRFAAGLAEAQAAFAIHLAGGDTDRRPGPMTVSITVLGEVPAGRMVRRATARPGDHLFVSGTLGDAALGLALRLDPGLAARLSLSPSAASAAIARYLRPKPRLALRDALRRHARAAMDLSDGLAKDLGRMARASGTGAEVRLADLPLSDAVAAFAAVAASPLPGATDPWQAIAASGDDYEVLAAVPPDRAADFAAEAGAAGRIADPPFAVTRIGTVTPAGPGASASGDSPSDLLRLVAPDGRLFVPQRKGWDHF